MAAPILSKSWKVKKQLQGFYTGGKVVLSSNEKFLVCSRGDDLTVIDLATGEIRAVLESEEDGFLTFALHPNDVEVVTSCKSGLIKHWNLASKECIRSFRGHDQPMIDIAFDPSGTYIATASIDRTVRVWDLAKGFCTHNFRGHQSPVRCVAFHPSVKKMALVSCEDEGPVRVWDLRTKSSHRLINHMSAVTSVSFSPDAQLLFTASRDKVMNVWDLETYTLRTTLTAFESLSGVHVLPSDAHFPNKPLVDPSPDTLYFAIAGEKGSIRIFQYPTFKCFYQAKSTGHSATNQEIQHLLFSRKPFPSSVPISDQKTDADLMDQSGEVKEEKDSRTEYGLISVSAEHNLYFWKLANFSRVKLLIGFNDEILNVKLFPDGTHAAVATNSEQIRVYNLSTLSAELLVGHTDIVLSLDISSDGRFLVSSSKDHTVRVWHCDFSDPVRPAYRCVAVGVGHTEPVGAVACSRKPITATSYFVSASKDRTLKVWRFAPILEQLSADEKEASSEALKLVSDVGVVAHDKDINCVAISPNDKLIATASADKSIKLWNRSDLSLAGALRGHKRGVWSIEFSTVDKCIASASSDRTVKVWSVTDFTCLKTFEGHAGGVLNVQFFNHGMQLMSTGTDGALKLWTIKTNECANTFPDDHSDKVWALAMSRDQRTMLTGGADSTLNLWCDVTEEEMEMAQAAEADRLLQEQQLSNCLLDKDYGQAVAIALRLKQPRRLFTILEEMIHVEAEDDMKDSSLPSHIRSDLVHLTGVVSEAEAAHRLQLAQQAYQPRSRILERLVRGLTVEQITEVLNYVRDWNTNGKHCFVAHRVLAALTRTLPPSKLKQSPQLKEVVKGVIAYSERHLTRLDALLQKSFLIDYTVLAMKKLSPLESKHQSQDILSDVSDSSLKRKFEAI